MYWVCACVELCDVCLFYFILFYWLHFFSFTPFTLFCAVHFYLLMSTLTKQILLGQWFTDLSCFPFFLYPYSFACTNRYNQRAEAEGRLRLKCDGTRAETRFRLSAKGRVHLNLQGRQFNRLLAADVCASAVVMLDTPCSEVVWRVLDTYSILQFPLHFPVHASPCAITFQLESTFETLIFRTTRRRIL
jgi:hypothetical protein